MTKTPYRPHIAGLSLPVIIDIRYPAAHLIPNYGEIYEQCQN